MFILEHNAGMWHPEFLLIQIGWNGIRKFVVYFCLFNLYSLHDHEGKDWTTKDLSFRWQKHVARVSPFTSFAWWDSSIAPCDWENQLVQGWTNLFWLCIHICSNCHSIFNYFVICSMDKYYTIKLINKYKPR